jgi:hypothetical protein
MNEPKIVTVRLLEKALTDHYGPTRRIELDKALLGEAKGKWRIIREDDDQHYDTRVMSPEGQEVDHNPLARADVHGQTYATKEIKKKRIGWVQDLVRVGGAEISNQEVRRVGNDCGFEVMMITPESLQNNEQLTSVDLFILNNIWYFSQEQMAVILRTIYAGTPYVKYEHDYRELQRPEFSTKLFNQSKLNVFLSPKHLKDYQKGLKCDGLCLPLAIDINHFKPAEKAERKENSALVFNTPNRKLGKSGEDFIKANPEMMFTILSNNNVPALGTNIVLSPPVPYKDLPMLYSAHEYLVHLPDRDWAGERIIFEAALCGCKVIANDHVGHMSWKKDLTDNKGLAEWLTQAPYEFWKRVGEIEN